MIRKLESGDNFPRQLLCARKSSLGIGLIDPTTAAGILAMKLRIGNKRLQGEASKGTSEHEEIIFLYSGLKKQEGKTQINCADMRDGQKRHNIIHVKDEQKLQMKIERKMLKQKII